MNENVFTDFDFSLLDSPDFKEDSVREELVLPILKALGYSTKGENKIIRSKTVTHPFVKVGTKKRELKNYPDYLLEVAGKYAWVLDAKAPTEEVKTGENVEQAFFIRFIPKSESDFTRFTTAMSLLFLTDIKTSIFVFSSFGN